MDFDYLIIGAGVVGLAVAELLTRNNYRILVIEKENRIGTGVSSRNSEVIHAGIYYPADSLKSQLCIRGKELLYEWCHKYKVPHSKIGKFIIATNEADLSKLQKIKDNAANAGMKDLSFVTAEDIKKAEPYICCMGGLYSPTTGIISAHKLMESLKQRSEENGADFLFGSTIINVAKSSESGGYFATIQDNTGDISDIETCGIINCAGLYSDKVAQVLGVKNDSYRIKFVKGNYFRLKGKRGRFNHLIYPVPMPKLQGLGIHITLDLNNEVRFGPDVENNVLLNEFYDVNISRQMDFYNAIKTYFPLVKFDDLYPDMAGIRPKLVADKDFNDFIINEESNLGLPKIVNCVGIESPGLTSSLAIAEHIYNILLN